MQAHQQQIDKFIVSTQIGELKEPNDFIIEFYPFTSDATSQEKPLKVIHNFDELIDFFEMD